MVEWKNSAKHTHCLSERKPMGVLLTECCHQQVSTEYYDSHSGEVEWATEREQKIGSCLRENGRASPYKRLLHASPHLLRTAQTVRSWVAPRKREAA